MNVHNFPFSRLLDHDAAFVMSHHLHTVGQRGAGQQRVTGNRRIAITLNAKIGKIEAGFRFLFDSEPKTVPFCALDVIMNSWNGKPSMRLWCNPPFVKRKFRMPSSRDTRKYRSPEPTSNDAQENHKLPDPFIPPAKSLDNHLSFDPSQSGFGLRSRG